MGWRYKRASLYLKVVRGLGLDPLHETVQDDLRHELDTRFSLAEYLAANVGHGVIDVVEVHAITWFVIMVMWAIFAVLALKLKLSFLNALVPALIIISVLVLVFMGFMVRQQVRTLDSQASAEHSHDVTQEQEEHFREFLAQQDCPRSNSFKRVLTMTSSKADTKSIHQRLPTEMITIRVLQALLFVISYAFARTLLDVEDWNVRPTNTALMACLFALLFAVLSRFVPKLMPSFLAVMALPPFVDDDNLTFLFPILFNDRRHEIAANESRSYPAHAPVADHVQASGSASFMAAMADMQRRVSALEQAYGHLPESAV